MAMAAASASASGSHSSRPSSPPPPPASYRLTLTVHHAKDLMKIRGFGKMDPYVSIWVHHELNKDAKTGVVKTVTHKNGDCYPIWENRLQIIMPSYMKSGNVVFVIKNDGCIMKETIGEVCVQLDQLLSGNGKGRSVCYPVVINKESGEKKGELVISYEIKPMEVGESPSEQVDNQGRRRRNFGQRFRRGVLEFLWAADAGLSIIDSIRNLAD